MNAKGTVKSCGCAQCRRGKASKAGNFAAKQEQRAARRQAAQALRKDPLEAVVAPAHMGAYKD